MKKTTVIMKYIQYYLKESKQIGLILYNKKKSRNAYLDISMLQNCLKSFQ